MKKDGERIAQEISSTTFPTNAKVKPEDSPAFAHDVEIGGYEKGADEIRENSSELAEQVMKDADAFKAKTETLSTWAEWGSVSIYVIGAIIGLYGKLIGAGESSPE